MAVGATKEEIIGSATRELNPTLRITSRLLISLKGDSYSESFSNNSAFFNSSSARKIISSVNLDLAFSSVKVVLPLQALKTTVEVSFRQNALLVSKS